eukprot:1151607-Pelagomonas_calceolata.AAC.5
MEGMPFWPVAAVSGGILKLRARSDQYAYKLASTRRALEKTSLNSHRQDQTRSTASNPPDPH